MHPRFTMEQLHKVIQISMEWEDAHLHQFIEKGGNTYAHPRVIEHKDIIDERYELLESVFAAKGKRIAYEYDFGDSWLHQIEFEDMIESDSFDYPFKSWVKNGKGVFSGKPRAAICVGGDRSAPPEDCGGIPGFEEILRLAALPPKSRTTRDDRERLEWLGDWKPDNFHLDWPNQQLGRMRVKKAFLEKPQ